ncbi:MAG: phenylacetic acid degradation protein PaaY [Betaproteobacteria bacterium]|jgi:phenylacetic acid degradation protein|nr:phenylacetic acid degradation protein PaaY [Betaproteobacteria bacterium]
MVKVFSIEGVTPVVHPSTYVHPSATLIGDVIIGPDCYIGPSACLRGDFGRIRIERGVNIQDCCIVHGFPERDTVVEENGHIGHGAVLHCCRIGKNALVGMNAVVMDKAEVGESSIVAAMAFVKAGMAVPAKSLVAGMPAKVVRQLSEQEMAWKHEGTVLYQHLARRSLATMTETVALTEVEADRKRILLPDIKPLIEAKAEWAGMEPEIKPE